MTTSWEPSQRYWIHDSILLAVFCGGLCWTRAIYSMIRLSSFENCFLSIVLYKLSRTCNNVFSVAYLHIYIVVYVPYTLVLPTSCLQCKASSGHWVVNVRVAIENGNFNICWLETNFIILCTFVNAPLCRWVKDKLWERVIYYNDLFGFGNTLIQETPIYDFLFQVRQYMEKVVNLCVWSRFQVCQLISGMIQMELNIKMLTSKSFQV